MQRYAESYVIETRAFVDAVLAGQDAVARPALDGRAALQIAMAARESLADGHPVALTIYLTDYALCISWPLVQSAYNRRAMHKQTERPSQGAREPRSESPSSGSMPTCCLMDASYRNAGLSRYIYHLMHHLPSVAPDLAFVGYVGDRQCLCAGLADACLRVEDRVCTQAHPVGATGAALRPAT